MNALNAGKLYDYRCSKKYVIVECSECGNFQLRFKAVGIGADGEGAVDIELVGKIN